MNNPQLGSKVASAWQPPAERENKNPYKNYKMKFCLKADKFEKLD
jgi:hypothetical protein